jgi:hypothetical protein
MKKYLALILALFFMPSIAHATVLLTESWENGWNDWAHDYGKAVIVSGGRTGNALRFTLNNGDDSGNSPDIVNKFFTGVPETWGQFYVKVSSNWEWPSISDKYFFIWGPDSNACLLQMWGNTLDFTSQVTPNFTLYGTGTAAAFTKNAWNKVTYHAITSSPGGSNGTIQVWVNDTLIINSSSVPWGNGANFNQVAFEMVWGGPVGTRKNGPYYVWFDDLTIQTTPFDGGGTLTSPTSKTPGYPSKLIIN